MLNAHAVLNYDSHDALHAEHQLPTTTASPCKIPRTTCTIYCSSYGHCETTAMVAHKCMRIWSQLCCIHTPVILRHHLELFQFQTVTPLFRPVSRLGVSHGDCLRRYYLLQFFGKDKVASGTAVNFSDNARTRLHNKSATKAATPHTHIHSWFLDRFHFSFFRFSPSSSSTKHPLYLSFFLVAPAS